MLARNDTENKGTDTESERLCCDKCTLSYSAVFSNCNLLELFNALHSAVPGSPILNDLRRTTRFHNKRERIFFKRTLYYSKQGSWSVGGSSVKCSCSGIRLPALASLPPSDHFPEETRFTAPAKWPGNVVVLAVTKLPTIAGRHLKLTCIDLNALIRLLQHPHLIHQRCVKCLSRRGLSVSPE